MEDKQKEKEERIKKAYGDTSRKILEIINKNKEEKKKTKDNVEHRK